MFGSFVGVQPFPPGCSLKFTMGHQLGLTDRVMVDAVLPGQEYDISVAMTSPSTPGIYEGQWRMCTPTGVLFGGKSLITHLRWTFKQKL